MRQETMIKRLNWESLATMTLAVSEGEACYASLVAQRDAAWTEYQEAYKADCAERSPKSGNARLTTAHIASLVDTVEETRGMVADLQQSVDDMNELLAYHDAQQHDHIWDSRWAQRKLYAITLWVCDHSDALIVGATFGVVCGLLASFMAARVF